MSAYSASIKIAQKNAGLNDDSYRQMLQRVAGVSSSKDLDARGAKAVLAELHRMTTLPNKRPAEGKIWALWFELRELLPEDERKTQYLFGFASKAIGRHVTSFEALTRAEEVKTIESLKCRLAAERWKRSPLNQDNYRKQEVTM